MPARSVLHLFSQTPIRLRATDSKPKAAAKQLSFTVESNSVANQPANPFPKAVHHSCTQPSNKHPVIKNLCSPPSQPAKQPTNQPTHNQQARPQEGHRPLTANPKLQPGSFTFASNSVANQSAKSFPKAVPHSCTQSPNKHPVIRY